MVRFQTLVIPLAGVERRDQKLSNIAGRLISLFLQVKHVALEREE